jgi:hypothetical protein
VGTILILIFFGGGAIALVGVVAEGLKIVKSGEGIIHFGQYVMMGAAALWIIATIVLTLDSARIVTP